MYIIFLRFFPRKALSLPARNKRGRDKELSERIYDIENYPNRHLIAACLPPAQSRYQNM